MAPPAAMPAVLERKRRRVGSTGAVMLLLKSAWAMGLYLWFELEPGRKLALPPGLLLRYNHIYEEVNNGCTKKERSGPPPNGRKGSSHGGPHAGNPDRRGGSLGREER